MPKKKANILRKPTAPLPSALLTELRNADALLTQKRAPEAISLLEDLNRRYPNRAEVLTDLVNAAYETKNMPLYARAAEGLLKLTPNMPDLTLALASAHLNNTRIALAMLAVRDFPTRWPHHALTEDAKKMIANLEKILPEYLEGSRLTGPDGLELAALHERTQSLLESGQYREMRQAAKQLLDRRPNYAPTLNNVSQSYYAEGDIDNAIITARSVLDFEPDNVHALGNLTHYAVLTGFPDEAREFAASLKASQAYAYQKQLKIAESLTYVGDDAGVLAAWKRAEAKPEDDSSFEHPLLHHLAGVAALRQGKPEEARAHWKQALALQPTFDLARKNLADLSLPVEQRHAPWPYSASNWMLSTVLRTLKLQLPAAIHHGGEALPKVARALVSQHPELISIVPILLEKGEPEARTLALLLARNADSPELLTALRDFALSSHGPDELRLQALQAASEAGLVEVGATVRMWLKGEWQETISMNYEIYSEPMVRHAPHIQDKIEKGMENLSVGNLQEAEAIFTQALEEEPDDPTILNNLAATYQVQERDEDFKEMIRYVHAGHPDYFFGCVNMAHILIWEGKIEEASALLEPLTKQKRLHVSEASALASAQIELLIAREEPDGAQTWLNLMEQVAPDNRNIPILKQRIQAAMLASKFAALTGGFKNRRKRKTK